ncbi:MAG: ATP-dependent 6-phosphofructokinase [Bacteroidales bacterium]|jgi:6-phosphofructokinase 1|nr:ATP-dependent 6-phosphofructokinase [Bacteroidales bacterium]
MRKRRVLVATGGGDCPGLNAVISAIVRRAARENEWEVFGCKESFNGILKDNFDLGKDLINLTEMLSENNMAGFHARGGTILKTVNKGGPFLYPKFDKEGRPVLGADGGQETENRADIMKQRLEEHGFEAVINIGGDGSQKISAQLQKIGINMIGVPKTIDNDLSSTDFTFGFQTAVQIASDALDRLVTTADSHNRTFIMEVMGRDAGWIALHAAISGGADVCLIPEIQYDPQKIAKKICSRYNGNEGFCTIVIAEGARNQKGMNMGQFEIGEVDPNVHYSGAADRLMNELKNEQLPHEIRLTVLGHLQRGGTPVAYDRVLATAYGVKAFEMVLNKDFGCMVAYRHPNYIAVPFAEAIAQTHLVNPSLDYLVKTAKGIGMSFGD